MKGNVVPRPVREDAGDEFAEQIMEDLVGRGYGEAELPRRFKEEQRKVRPAVEAMLAEASQIATSKADYASYDEVFADER